jgi:hypothetical protein
MRPGRPIETRSGKRTVNISFTLDSSLLEPLDQICHRERLSRSEVVNDKIEKFVKEHLSGNDTYQITNWQEDPEFQAVPAFFSDKEKWKNHFINSDQKDRTTLNMKVMELKNLFYQIQVEERRK